MLSFVGFILFAITNHPIWWSWMSTYLKDWHILGVQSATYVPGSPKFVTIFQKISETEVDKFPKLLFLIWTLRNILLDYIM